MENDLKRSTDKLRIVNVVLKIVAGILMALLAWLADGMYVRVDLHTAQLATVQSDIWWVKETLKRIEDNTRSNKEQRGKGTR